MQTLPRDFFYNYFLQLQHYHFTYCKPILRDGVDCHEKVHFNRAFPRKYVRDRLPVNNRNDRADTRSLIRIISLIGFYFLNVGKWSHKKSFSDTVI